MLSVGRGTAALTALGGAVVLLCVVGFGSMQGGLLSTSNAYQRASMLSTSLESDEYRSLLHREKNVLRSGPGGLDWGNKRFLANAATEQDSYVAQKNAKALVEGKQAQKDAAKLFNKWSDPYRGTVYEKYDNPAEDKAKTMQLAQVDSTAAKLRQLSEESKKKQREAQASCKGNAGCEKILEQVLNLVHHSAA